MALIPSSRPLGEITVPVSEYPSRVLRSYYTYNSLAVGGVHSIGDPIHVYPLFENGFRAHRGQTLAENHDESAQLYADFAKVAENQPFAWNYGSRKSKEDIAAVTKRNRMICLPCMMFNKVCDHQTAFADLDISRSSSHECVQYRESCWSSHLDVKGLC